jgi:histidinol-phosphatase
MNVEWRSRYNLAVELGRKAGLLARSYYDSSFSVEWKHDATPVTIADKNAEALIREQVKKYFPGDGFLGEEFGNEESTTGYRWIIDPIDGTRSFVRHIPIWGTLIGLEYKGEQIAGVTYIPCWNVMYRALRGDGAYRDDQRIYTSQTTNLADAFLCYSSVGWFRRAGRESTFMELASRTLRQRGYGDFYGFVLVAEGAMDMMVEHGVHPWDVAATKPIVEEAGGTFTDWKNIPTIHTPDVLASNSHLHAEVLSILNS